MLDFAKDKPSTSKTSSPPTKSSYDKVVTNYQIINDSQSPDDEIILLHEEEIILEQEHIAQEGE